MDKSLAKPTISVIMSVYNGAPYLREAVDSILGQSFQNIEFIIVDDGSTDASAKILSSYTDPRMHIITHTNQGLVASLNTGIKAAAGELIARQDADDVSLPSRLEQQTKLLAAKPEVVIVGTSLEIMDDAGKVLHTHHVLLDDPELRQELLIRSPFAHGSVMFQKKAALEAGLYDADFWPAEDYEFWLRLSNYGQLANIDEPLYRYRENTQGISAQNAVHQTERKTAVQTIAWHQRKRLVTGGRINLKKYRSLPDGQLRIERISANINQVSRSAAKQKAYLFAAQNLALVHPNPTAGRAIAGRVKRRLRRPKA